MKTVLEQEFDPSVVAVEIVKQDVLVGILVLSSLATSATALALALLTDSFSSACQAEDDFSIVLENTNDKLHCVPLGAPAVFPTEMEGLMVVSKIGTWLSRQQ